MKGSSLALVNAKVTTLNPEQPKAQAIYVENDRIVAVGSNKKIERYVTEKTQVCDVKGAAIIPGLVDCHVHMTSFGTLLSRLDLTGTKSINELRHRLSEYTRKNPERSWIIGRRWDQEQFSDHRYPTREDLDAAVNGKPVLIIRVCGHLGVANSLALKVARITKKASIDGGKIEHDSSGEPNGILKENALELIDKAIPKLTCNELRRAFQLACDKAVQNGLTAVHWLVDSPEEIRTLQEMHTQNKLPLRVYLGISGNLLDDLANLGLKTGFGDDMLKIGFVKIFADGSLGAHTAALEKPYDDDPGNVGMLLYSQEQLNDMILKAHNGDLQVGVHAIGDRAIHSVIKAYKNAFKRNPRKYHRDRIEHYSVLNRNLIKDTKSTGIIASIQPHFVVSDFWVKNRVGDKRARMVYPFKTLMQEGVLLISGSDCPIENISPLLGIWAATSQHPFPEENLTVSEALKTYTSNAAFSTFDEQEKGAIKIGYLADFTVLSKDMFEIDPGSIKDVRVEMTVVGGKIVFTKEHQSTHY